jgi:acid phosphatase type 7
MGVMLTWIVREKHHLMCFNLLMGRVGNRVVEVLGLFSLVVTGTVFCLGQSTKLASELTPTVAMAQAGTKFQIAEKDLHQPVTVIAYGDMRFTDPNNLTATNPSVRKALVTRIAEENPDAVLLTGDVPWHGGDEADYSVFKTETKAWRDTHLRIFPTLGNHEFAQCEPQQCLGNWWRTFPDLEGRRWYSVQLGTQVYTIVLDSNASLLPHSEQARWLETEIASLSQNVRFVLILLHHPPVADIQTKMFVDHNPRQNEIALSNFLETDRKSRARFVVVAGHIHNYERFEQNGVVYLVSGGGGAVPYPVERTPADAYQDTSFPNYHYVKFAFAEGSLKGTMYRLADPRTLAWEVKDTFEIPALKTAADRNDFGREIPAIR